MDTISYYTTYARVNADKIYEKQREKYSNNEELRERKKENMKLYFQKKKLSPEYKEGLLLKKEQRTALKTKTTEH